MARIQWVHERLLRWAQGITVGDGNGFPAMSMIHPQWQPPTPGQTPTMKVGPASDTRRTHDAVGQLPPALVATVMAHYVLRLSDKDAAAHPDVDCQPATVPKRIETAHRLLARMWDGSGVTCRSLWKRPRVTTRPNGSYCDNRNIG